MPYTTPRTVLLARFSKRRPRASATRSTIMPNFSAADSPPRNKKKAIRMLNVSSSNPLINILPIISKNALAGAMSRRASAASFAVSVARVCQYSTARDPTNGTLASQSGGAGGPVSIQPRTALLKSRTSSDTAAPMTTKGNRTTRTIPSVITSAASVRRPPTSLSTRV